MTDQQLLTNFLADRDEAGMPGNARAAGEASGGLSVLVLSCMRGPSQGPASRVVLADRPGGFAVPFKRRTFDV